MVESLLSESSRSVKHSLNLVLLSNILWTLIVIRIQTVITSMLYILCLARFILISVELIKWLSFSYMNGGTES